MSVVFNETPGSDPSRRQFIKGASVVLAGGAVLGVNARIARSANISGSDEIKIGVIGCGGRGQGAAAQALETKGKVTLWSVCDAFADNMTGCLESLKRTADKESKNKDSLWYESRVDVPSERQFVGFDGFQQVIDSGVDLVILATPPHFRPQHFESCVKAGKHIFCEKPVAVDAPGIRRFLAANEMAKEKNLMVAIGLQRRHDPRYVETIQRIHDGAIGDVIATRVYWNSGGLWVRPRKPEQTEMEYQMRNWYYFNWLCGDHIVEQHIHNIDAANWLMGMYPTDANGMGGRQVRTGKEFGQIYDHHCVEFTYPDGRKMFSQCRQIEGCQYENGELVTGSLGTANLEPGIIETQSGKSRCQAKNVDGTLVEQRDLFAALGSGDIYNEAEYGAKSTMTAILGRMATYSGKKVTWDEALKSQVDLSPKEYNFTAQPSVIPDADGHYPIIMPGKTDLSHIV
jgi:myo-inositol 2-dehydrogenase / D-chiro-inositol 1-dehydrogenase